MEDLITPTLQLLLLLLTTTVLLLRHRSHLHPSTPPPPLLPPSPWSLPLLGHLHHLGPLPHQSLHHLSLRLGPLFHLRLGSVPCIVASSPATAMHLLKTHDLTFSSRPLSSAVRRLTYDASDFSFAPYGPYWKFMKKLCMSDLLGGRTLDVHRPVRRDEVHRLMRRFAEVADMGGGGDVDVGEEVMSMSNNVISRMLMGRRCSGTAEEAEGVRRIILETAEGLKKRVEDVHRRFDGFMEGVIREKERRREDEMEGGYVKDLLDLLLDISEDEEAEMRISRENIKAFALDIFAAGTDTSAITIQWALAELINHPDILEKARQEIDTIVGPARVVDEPDIPNLPYLQAIVKETLRLHPTGPLTVRESIRDCHVSGYDIPAGTRLFVNIWAIGRDPAHWPDPEDFRPERFLGDGTIDVRGQHYQLLPFGSGRRMCPGTSLAMHVVQTTVAAMVQCFEWRVKEGKVDMAEGPGLTLPMARPLVCVPVKRLDLF
ncbi:Cytochrome P450 93A3 [Acorus calamus]|uniref:Cytochrome P450 93A3 n=1 Tax=Acorus calamus TaxID=4465 RepID=A0AAV9CHM2_ACOCL|nr:Cytochrome P450 93A3 [Acorus calamus]